MNDKSGSEKGGFRITELARNYGIPPKKICDLFWRGKLDGSCCLIVGGRRMIPADYVGEVERVLQECGYLQTQAAR